MKKSGHLFLAFFLLIGVGVLLVIPHFIHKPISKVLESEAYSYLSKEAKDYIQEMYEESGQIVLTEKNRKENEPYLNPQFVEYLSSTPEERESMSLVPTPLILEYSVTLDEDNATYPSSYDLRSVNGNSYVTPIKDQSTLNLCWSFTTTEQIESLLMVKNGTPYNSNSTILSTRMLDYASSTNGITDYNNDYGTRDLTEGGNFLTSTIVGYNGLGLANENYMPFNTSSSTKELATVLNYDKTLYEIESTVRVPMITDKSTSTDIDSFVNTVKQLVVENGGAYVGTQAPGYSCSINTAGGSALIRVDDSCVENAGHAMQIIGWNDNYSYSYCQDQNNKKHTTNTSSCNGTVVSGTGAWLLRNSWGGSNYPYVYLAYNSINDDVYVFTGVSPMSSRNWDNNYHKDLDSFSIYYGYSDTQYFTKKIDTKERVKKVKFFAFGQGGTFRISVNSGNYAYSNIKTVSVPYPGFYTVDLTDKNIVIDGEDFSVTVTSSNGVNLVNKSIAVFTSNVDSTPIIQSTVDNIELASLSSNYSMRLYSHTKNIPANSTISYSLWDVQNQNVSNYINVSNTTVAKNDVNASLMIRSSIPAGRYTLKLTYQNATEEIPVRIGDPVIFAIQFEANGGSGVMNSQMVEAFTSVQLNSNNFLRTGYSFQNWNTKSNGNGNSYEDRDVIPSVTDNMTLYAQWIPNTYYIQFQANGGSGSMAMQIMTYDVPSSLSKNAFTKENYVFTGWNTMSNGSGTSYPNEDVVYNLTPTKNGIVNLFAQWVERQEYVKVFYKPNGGTGEDYYQTVRNSETFTLDDYAFSKTGYSFQNWNTKSNGNGTTYNNKQVVDGGIELDLTLYAQWIPNTYTIRFHANGGEGTMSDQEMTYDVPSPLNNNLFTNNDLYFAGWNTQEDGNGTSYNNKENVTNLTDVSGGVVHLYAQWSEEPATTYVINHYTVDDNHKIIDKIEPNTSLSKYESYFELGDGYTISIDLHGKTSIYTGSVVEIYYDDELVTSFTNIIRGDSNGDGVINSGDLLKVVKHLKNTSALSGVYLKAADCNYDNTINSGDLLKVVKYLRGTGTI